MTVPQEPQDYRVSLTPVCVIRCAGPVCHPGAMVHAQVQAAALGADGDQPAGGAGRRVAAVGALPADDRQRVPIRPYAQRAVQRPGDGRAHEAYTKPETTEMDVPAVDRGRARVYDPAADPARRSGRRHRAVVRHQAEVVVVPVRGRRPVFRVR